MSSNPGHGPAISAHRGGSEHGPGGTYEAYQNALAIGADYVEFDVRQTRDGVLVTLHEERARQGLRARPVATVSYSRLCQMSGFEVPQVAEVMRLLAGRARAHVDLKETGCAIAVTRLGLEVLGPAEMLVTTGAEILARYQRQGIRTMVWTVNADADLARWVAAPGVDALVTDRPARAIVLRG